MFWAGRDPHETLRELKQMGVSAGQLGVAGDYNLKGAAAQWKRAIEDEAFIIKTVFAAYTGESYSDVATVQSTVGFIPKSTRGEREKRTYQISDFARDIGVKSIACHIGFVPHDPSDPEYGAARELVRRIADYAQKNGQSFALETGQEPAEILANFIRDVGRPNLTINFDPANMIMYGSGDPIAAFSALFPQVESVHCKDGEWPVKEGALGVEKRLGDGAVGMEQFINKVKQLGYTGILAIEREVEDPEQRKRDLRHGVELLQRLRRQ
jgi:L-ribulose-5-phosphate 3-epimerase